MHCSRQNNYPICSYVTVKAQTVEENLGLPNRPKKPMTPYFRFMKDVRPEIAASNPKVHLTEIVKLVAKRWADVDEKKKKMYEEEYKKDQIAYIGQRAAYESQLTDEQKEQIKDYKRNVMLIKEKREVKKKLSTLGKPKKPISAFLHYLAEERVKAPHKIGSFRDWQKSTAEKWKKLSESDKEKYNKIAKTDLQKYK